MLKNLPLRVKILLICLSFLFPISYLLYSIIGAFDKDIEFARLELKGTRLLRPAISLLTKVSELHQQITAEERTAELDPLIKAIDSDFKKLSDIDKEIGTDLQFTDSGLAQRKRERYAIPVVIKSWEALKQTSLAKDKPTTLTEMYRTLIADLRGITTHAGDTSNLILDPDLDSYYLMDAVLLAIPQHLDRLDQLKTMIRQIKKANLKEIVEASIMASMLREADIERTASDVQTTISEDINFYGVDQKVQTQLAPGFEIIKKSSEPVLAGLLGLKLDDSAGSLWEASLALEKAAFSFSSVGLETLDSLLNERVSHYVGSKNRAIVVSAILVFLLIVGSYFAISRITKSIEKFAHEVSRQSESLARVSDQLNGSVQESSTSITKQSAAIEETVSSMEEMSSMIGMTTQNASGTGVEIEKTNQSAERGQGVVRDMVHSMGEISKANDKLQGIVKVIDDINSKTKVINDIAFETRLLAFNASIEAARAGAHGRGFAVVAEEVGKLANISSKAADEIRTLLDQSASDVSTVLAETRTRVMEGQRTSEACFEAFSSMKSSVKGILDGIERISVATREQEAGVKQANQAMREMEVVAQDNARGGNDIANQSHELRSAADRLKASAAGLYSLVLGAKDHKADRNGPSKSTRRQLLKSVPPKSNQKDDRSEISTTVNDNVASESSISRDDSRWHSAG